MSSPPVPLRAILAASTASVSPHSSTSTTAQTSIASTSPTTSANTSPFFPEPSTLHPLPDPQAANRELARVSGAHFLIPCGVLISHQEYSRIPCSRTCTPRHPVSPVPTVRHLPGPFLLLEAVLNRPIHSDSSVSDGLTNPSPTSSISRGLGPLDVAQVASTLRLKVQ